MQPLLERILTFNLIATTGVFYVAARLYLLPRLGQLGARSILLPILLLHSLRHLGLMFLTRGAIYPGMPWQFAYPAGVGDLLTALLAFVSIPAVTKGWKIGRPLVWAFNIFGTLDLLLAITLATIYHASVYGPGLLDTGVLGPCSLGDALRHLHRATEGLGVNGILPGEAAQDGRRRGAGGRIVEPVTAYPCMSAPVAAGLARR